MPPVRRSSPPASFPNVPPPARLKRIKDSRQSAQTSFEQFATGSFPACPPGPKVCPTPFGGDKDEQALAQKIMSSAATSTKDSEQLGELGAVEYLQRVLAKKSLKYDDKNLRIFDGANTFNMVYFSPDLQNPTAVVVIEAKGGNSGLGTRTDPATGATVTQGTPAYFAAEVHVMSGSSNQAKADAANRIQRCMGKTPPQIAYIGVRTKYDKKKGKVYDPVQEFHKGV